MTDGVRVFTLRVTIVTTRPDKLLYANEPAFYALARKLGPETAAIIHNGGDDLGVLLDPTNPEDRAEILRLDQELRVHLQPGIVARIMDQVHRN